MDLKGARKKIERYLKPRKWQKEPQTEPAGPCKVFTAEGCSQAFLTALAEGKTQTEANALNQNKGE
jgi:hypothetical protein